MLLLFPFLLLESLIDLMKKNQGMKIFLLSISSAVFFISKKPIAVIVKTATEGDMCVEKMIAKTPISILF